MDPAFAERLQNTSIEIVPFIMAVTFHEYAHGFIANQWGDNTAKKAGRLTLNPVPHIDPVGTILFPLINMLTGIPILFGWAKPVPIDPRLFRKYRSGLFFVSIAGVSMNCLLAVLSAAALCAILLWMPPDFYLFKPLSKMAVFSVEMNFALAIFNLIPLPPLDGSKIVQSFLSIELTRKYEQISRYSFFIIMALMFSGAFSVLRYPIGLLTNVSVDLMAYAFHLPASAFSLLLE
jgi:Zn-dependent protease